MSQKRVYSCLFSSRKSCYNVGISRIVKDILDLFMKRIVCIYNVRDDGFLGHYTYSAIAFTKARAFVSILP